MRSYWQRSFKGVVFGGVVFLGCLVFAASVIAGDPVFHKEERPGFMEQIQAEQEKRVVEKDGWRLETEVLQPGSRSQGYHGVLIHDKKAVEGKRGQLLETPLGVLRYEGSKAERAHLWSHSGWKLIKRAPGLDEPQGRGGMPPGPKFQ